MKSILLLGLALVVAPASAQVGVSSNPCTAIPKAPAEVTAYFAERAAAKKTGKSVTAPSAEAFKLYKDWRAQVREADFPDLCRYQADNAALPTAGAHRVIFFGDSITELWALDMSELFTGDTINRGISGQTSEQMLGRFRADVIALKPKVVHIIAGTNDIAGNTGPSSLGWIEDNIVTMVDLARAHGITVVLGAVPPAARFPWAPGIETVSAIAAYNAWLRDYAAREHLAFVDYHDPLDDGHGGFKPVLTTDGVHPNPAGYEVMAKQARAAVAQALSHR